MQLHYRYIAFTAGGPGSGKGRVVGCLQSMFGMKLVSSEAIILKYLPKKVAHVMDVTSTDVSNSLYVTFSCLVVHFNVDFIVGHTHTHLSSRR